MCKQLPLSPSIVFPKHHYHKFYSLYFNGFIVYLFAWTTLICFILYLMILAPKMENKNPSGLKKVFKNIEENRCKFFKGTTHPLPEIGS